jgi:hypothetical protein
MFRSLLAALDVARREQGLQCAALLSEERIVECVEAARGKWRGPVYTAAVTVWTFLSQCLSADRSCLEAVARMLVWRVASGRPPCSADSSAFCTARDKLPEEACRELLRGTGREVEAEAPANWLWKDRRVVLGDGATVTMPDTPENRAEYPQQSGQAPGCGFPIARLVVLFSLAVGTALEVAIAPYRGKQTGENSLLRSLRGTLDPGDVLLLDRCFSGWCDLALMIAQGLDVVVRKHQGRRTDFRKGKRLGRDDHLVTWPKPQRPAWMDRETHDRLPDELVLREIRVRVRQKGFRSRTILVVTTLLDPEEYSHADLADLYRQRWQAELHLRSLKDVLGMDHLRCRTPHRVRNEILMHLTAYNLIRRVMAAAALEAGTAPRHVSFKGTLQTVNAFLPMLHSGVPLETWLRTLLASVATHSVGHRPDRAEPRRVKRRPKPYPLLQQPRAEYKSACAG